MLSEWPIKRAKIKTAEFCETIGTLQERKKKLNRAYRGDIVRFSLDFLGKETRLWEKKSEHERFKSHPANAYESIELAKDARFKILDITSILFDTQWLIACQDVATGEIGYINSGHMVKIQPEKKQEPSFFSKLFSKISLWS